MLALRAITCAVCFLSWLTACEQQADVVLRTEALDSGSVVMVEEPPPVENEPLDSGIACDPTVAAVYGVFSRVESDGCIFAFNDRAVIELLAQHIFSQAAPRPVAEDTTVSPCTALGLEYAFPRPDGTVLICPGYCTVLMTWLADHEAQSRACLPTAQGS